MDSDESDFYGDSGTKQRLQNRLDSFSVDRWAQKQAATPIRPLQKARPSALTTPQLHNPYAGLSYAWQLSESVDEFLARLPPQTTDIEVAPWIFICNPWKAHLKFHHSDELKESENEAPVEEGAQLDLITNGGLERLQILSSLHFGLQQAGKDNIFIRREMTKERKQAVEDILDLAHAAKVRTGKWLLFCPPEDVNKKWALVAKATANNELGIAAKVAPRSSENPDGDRLICVYTSDFRDRDDIGRVLRRLQELRVMGPRSRPVYYKPDAFTYIGISHGNTWGLPASICSSRDYKRSTARSR